MNFEDIIDGTTISAGDALSEKSWYRVLVTNSTIEGNGTDGGEFSAHARNVQLGPEAHAQAGSEFHIWAENTFGDCSSNAYRSATLTSVEAAPAERDGDFVRNLKLQFIAEEPPFSVYPNPAVTEVMVRLEGIADAVQLVLRDEAGRVVRHLRLGAGVHSISLVGLASGSYSLESMLDGALFVERFTKLP